MIHIALTTRGLAYCSFIGTLLSGMGGLYLTYDFFGGHEGPLGHLTRIFTYSVLFGLGYGLFLGTYFGLVMGIGLGLLLSVEFYRVRRHQKLFSSSPLQQSPLFGAVRGLLYGLASLRLFGGGFSLAFGLLCGLGLFTLYANGYALTNDFTSQSKIIFSRRRVLASVYRGLVVGLSGGIAGYLGEGQLNSTGFGLLIGLTVAGVSFIATIVSPRVEWWLENLPDKHLGVVGVTMILIGLGLQTIPDLVTIFGLPIEASQDSFRMRFRIAP